MIAGFVRNAKLGISLFSEDRHSFSVGLAAAVSGQDFAILQPQTGQVAFLQCQAVSAVGQKFKEQIFMNQNTDLQMLHLLYHFQNIKNEIEIEMLKHEGIIGYDGNLHRFGNAWEVTAQLRKDGWVIETERGRPSRYIFRGHYDIFSDDVQKQFIKAKAVSVPPHLFRTRPEFNG